MRESPALGTRASVWSLESAVCWLCRANMASASAAMFCSACIWAIWALSPCDGRWCCSIFDRQKANSAATAVSCGSAAPWRSAFTSPSESVVPARRSGSICVWPVLVPAISCVGCDGAALESRCSRWLMRSMTARASLSRPSSEPCADHSPARPMDAGVSALAKSSGACMSDMPMSDDQTQRSAGMRCFWHWPQYGCCRSHLTLRCLHGKHVLILRRLDDGALCCASDGETRSRCAGSTLDESASTAW